MSTALADLRVLLRVRAILLMRRGTRRYSSRAKAAAPVRFGLTVAAAVIVIATIIGPLSGLLTLSNSMPASTLERTLSTGSSASWLVIFFYALVSMVALLTYRSDLNLLLLTPVSPRLALAEKILSLALGFVPLLLLALPVLLGFGHEFHAGWSFGLVALLVLGLLPVAPASLAMLLVVPVLRLLPPARGKTIVTILGTILGGALFVGQQLLIGSHAGPSRNVVAPSLPAWLPTTWPGRTLSASALHHTQDVFVFGAGMVLITTVLFVLAVETSARAFTTGSATYREVARRSTRSATRTRRSWGDVDHGRRPRWWPLVHREWLMLRRDAQRLAALLYPLIVVGFYLYRLVSLRSEGGTFTLVMQDSLYGLAAFAAIVLIGALAPTLVNREGRSLYLLAMAPLTPLDIVVAKWMVCLIPSIPLVQALYAGSAAYLGETAVQIIVSAPILAALTASLAALALAVNLVWPKLGATEPRKQASGTASIVGFIAEAVVCVIVVGLLALTFSAPIPTWARVVTAATALAIAVALMAASLSLGARRLSAILQSDTRAV